MNRKLKIAIYSGTIPSTTFIENLIKGVSSQHTVLLFGKQKSKQNYREKTIFCYPTFSNTFYNLFITKWRTLLLLILHPKRFGILWKQLRSIHGNFAKYNWWSRYVPVLLHKPDVFHVQWAKDLDKWMFLKETLGCKVVLSLRGAHINYSPLSNPNLANSYRENFPKIDAFHAVCNAIGLETQKYGTDQLKIKMIHSLIPQSTFDLYRLPIKRDDNALSIISVGRHHWKKGYETALNACKILKDNKIPFTYKIVAGGKVPEELLFQSQQLNLTNEVIIQNSLSQLDLFEIMQENDVLLLPSLEEGIANVVLEAMALGIPVISTDCGGMSEVVTPNETGWLVPILDSELIAKTLIGISQIRNSELTKIVLNAHDLIKNEFNEEQVVKEFFELYQSLFKIES